MQEPIITIVGFLGAGKTTLLKHLVNVFAEDNWQPYVILNDYADARLDTDMITERLGADAIAPLTGSCICCDGINELRSSVNNLPVRDKGITLIEANGTSDASMLMGFLGVGLDERFLPPIQVSVVDVKNWQQRDYLNELEADQVRVSSLIVLTHLDGVPDARVREVEESVRTINPVATLVAREELDALLLPELAPVKDTGARIDHHAAHWSSCSVDLPNVPDLECLRAIFKAIPDTILRIKGCTRIGQNEGYTLVERCPDGRAYARPYAGVPETGAKLLTVGPGSEPERLRAIIEESLRAAQARVPEGAV